MKFKKNNSARNFLIVGILLTIIVPIIITYLNPKSDLSNIGIIGDAIGGITTPIVSILGAVLIYIALADQINANKLLIDQIEENKKQNVIQQDREQVVELYRLFEKNIDSFTFELQNGKDEKLYIGTIAIAYFIDKLIETTEDSHDTNIVKSDYNVQEFISIIKSAELLIVKIKNSHLNENDNAFYKNLILHKIEYNLTPNFSRIKNAAHAYVTCDCGIDHGRFPVDLYTQLTTIKNTLKNR